jgi:hypothetical protein
MDRLAAERGTAEHGLAALRSGQVLKRECKIERRVVALAALAPGGDARGDLRPGQRSPAAMQRGPAALDVVCPCDGLEERRVGNRLAQPIDRALDEGDLRRARVAHRVQDDLESHAA